VPAGDNACVQAWQALDLSGCKPLGFDLVGWAGILAVLVPAAFFVVRTFFRRRSRLANDNALKATVWRSKFRQLCRAIQPLMNENGRIFREFGPNSGAEGPARIVRQNLGVWKQTMATIVRNNARIRDLILANRDAFPARYIPLFEAWVNHIDAFEAHERDPLADYRHHQFPVEVVDVINRNA
jgi:hypothetical protein